MKLVIQRVKRASVKVIKTGKISGEIKKGLFVLFGVKKGDTKENADLLVEKISKLRIISDQNEKMNLSVIDSKQEILVVSQFTLNANTKDGNRPSFIESENPLKAKKLYKYFIDRLRYKGIEVKSGSFGDNMEITAVLDGPVTIFLES